MVSSAYWDEYPKATNHKMNITPSKQLNSLRYLPKFRFEVVFLYILSHIYPSSSTDFKATEINSKLQVKKNHHNLQQKVVVEARQGNPLTNVDLYCYNPTFGKLYLMLHYSFQTHIILIFRNMLFAMVGKVGFFLNFFFFVKWKKNLPVLLETSQKGTGYRSLIKKRTLNRILCTFAEWFTFYYLNWNVITVFLNDAFKHTCKIEEFQG